MLKQRIITALVMLMVLLPALFARNPIYWNCVTLVLIAAGSWEWARLNGMPQQGALLGGGLGLLLCLMAWGMNWAHRPLGGLWAVGSAFWLITGAVLLQRGVPSWAGIPRALRLVGGWFCLWLTWLAVVQARSVGIAFLLSIMLLVWMADVAAYFAGKGFGGRWIKVKLAPGISPGKSWEGALGGALGVLLLALVWLALEAGGSLSGPSLYGVLYSRMGTLGLALMLVFLSAMSVVGDLVESLVKRSAGMKDSSGLLPGHGGVLDRVDALLPTFPLAMWIYSWAVSAA